MKSKPKWWKEPLTENIHHGCLNCGGTETKLPIRTRLFYPEWTLKKNGEFVDIIPMIPNDEPLQEAWKNLPTVIKIENIAKKDPNNDWQIEMFMGLRGGSYQRHGDNNWILIESNQGYA